MKTPTLPPGTRRVVRNLDIAGPEMDRLAAALLDSFPDAVQLVVNVRTGRIADAPGMRQLEVRRDDGDALELLYSTPATPARKPIPPAVVASPDCGTVKWGDRLFFFTKRRQRAVVAALVRAEGLGGLRFSEFPPGGVRRLFEGHPAWGTMIVRRRGRFAIAEPK